MVLYSREQVLSWYVYLVRCADGTLYCGTSVDAYRRVREHNTSPRGAKYTRTRRPVVLVYEAWCKDRSTACKREAEIKKMTKADKERLVTCGTSADKKN